MAGLRGSKKVRERATELRQALAAGGVPVSHAEAEEMIVSQVETIAGNLGVTERTALDRYLTGPVMDALTQACLAAAAEHAEARQHAEEITMSIPNAGHVTVALGVVVKLVAHTLDEHPHDPDALGVATDVADAVVGLGHALRSPAAGTITIEGAHAVYARRVLTQTIEHLRDGSWPCPSHQHTPGTDCALTDALVQDLHRVGGWITPDRTERPAADR